MVLATVGKVGSSTNYFFECSLAVLLWLVVAEPFLLRLFEPTIAHELAVETGEDARDARAAVLDPDRQKARRVFDIAEILAAVDSL